MMKTVFLVVLVLSVAQGSSILEALKRVLNEENLEEKGVYFVKKTKTSIEGTIMVDKNDCPKPEDGCRYMVSLTDSNGDVVRTQSVTTGPSPVSFIFEKLDSTETYDLAACMLVNGQYNCGPKKARCDMTIEKPKCDYQRPGAAPLSKAYKRGVMLVTADATSISGTVQLNINDCPKPYNCDYTVLCRNPTTGEEVSTVVNTSETREFTCSGLQGGTYQVSACMSGNTQCGPRVGKCNLTTGKCGLKMQNSVKKSLEKKETMEKIAELLEELAE